ncbi:hypothetical protein EVAR_29617_1 [Eumeta japonica]|uniref:Uncharacterized protein n=1 Tax=Eumeta variegata TaxID=151549 RepID=A0A4C1VTC0_EUMVA|nr:hypothetical protein EVAR_29617_1 [Eumeta japonica]
MQICTPLTVRWQSVSLSTAITLSVAIRRPFKRTRPAALQCFDRYLALSWADTNEETLYMYIYCILAGPADVVLHFLRRHRSSLSLHGSVNVFRGRARPPRLQSVKRSENEVSRRVHSAEYAGGSSACRSEL